MRLLAAAAALVVIASGCSSSSSTPAAIAPKPKTKPVVAATTYPLYDAALYLAAGRLDVTHVREQGAFSDEPLSSEEKQVIDEADLVISPGRRTQPAFDVEVARKGDAHFDALGAIGKARRDEDPISSRDAYIWLDPIKFGEVIDAIAARYTQIDPLGEQAFEDRAFSFRKRLAALDKRLAHSLASCSRSDLVVEFGDFAPLAARYRLNMHVTNVVDPGSGLKEEDSVPLSELRKRGVDTTTVFTRELPTSRRADQILQDDDVRIAVLDSLGDHRPDARKSGADFTRMMKLNLDALKAALDCKLG